MNILILPAKVDTFLQSFGIKNFFQTCVVMLVLSSHVANNKFQIILKDFVQIIREDIKKRFCFCFFLNCLDPPTLYFLDSFEELKEFVQTKVPQSV